MAEARLRAELEESKVEIQRLKERLSGGLPTVHKDLSLVSLVPKWSGSDSGVPIEEFFASIEGAAQIGKWEEQDQIRIAVLKLTDALHNIHATAEPISLFDVSVHFFENDEALYSIYDQPDKF